MTREQLEQTTATAKDNIVVKNEREWVVPSRRVIGQTYLVARNREGVLTCNCEAAINGRRCWHIAAVAERFGADPTEPDWVRDGFKADPSVGIAILTGKRPAA